MQSQGYIMKSILGREYEKQELERLLKSGESEFIAIYGRRRVGKTFLISEFYKNKGIYFEATGQKNAKMPTQLENFADSLSETFRNGHAMVPPRTWREAFNLLKNEIKQIQTQKNFILFIDEVPWFSTRKSEFLSALEYFWNTWASRRKDIKLIVCGSASSWIIKKIVNSREGLHNRITATIRLLPFTLSESNDFLKSKGLKLDLRQVLSIYMIMGGIPYYLRHLQKGLSADQNINRMCFKKDGVLVDEFDRLYDSLFENSVFYKDIVKNLSKVRYGLNITELSQKLDKKKGGTLVRALHNLEEAGFISSYTMFGQKKKNTKYRLIDEYSCFYLHWIQGVDKSILNDRKTPYWQTVSQGQRWKIWSGFTFEGICIKHTQLLKKALGISGVITRESFWSNTPAKGDEHEQGAQIDLLIDRNDKVISICEMKYHNTVFTITKKYADDLRNKINIFREKTLTKKSIFLVMVTAEGVKQNNYYRDLVDNEITLGDLFE